MYKAPSLRVNIIANLISQVSGILVPLITFPYVSRVLKPEGLGRVNFAEAVASYFVMVAALGIPVYGVRESAKLRDDKAALSTLAAELFMLNTIMTAGALAAFGVFLVFSRKANADPVLFGVCAIPILVTPLGFNWLFGGLEEYIYITLRGLVIRILVVAAVFLFIRTQEDYRVYALLASLNTAGVGLVNIAFVRKHISVRRVDRKKLDMWRHLKPVLLVFSLGSIVSIYTSVNKVMLGYLANDSEVGLYAAADRVIKAVVLLVTSTGLVLLPRTSYYIEREKMSEYRQLATTIIRFILFVSFPATAGLIAVAGPLMLLLLGPAFERTIPLVHIMGLDVLLIALSHFLGYQVLYSQGKEKSLLYSVVLGAVANVLLNGLLIPRWHATGAAVSTLAAESCVIGMRVILSRAYAHLAWPVWGALKYGVTALFMAAVVLFLRSLLAQTVLGLLLLLAAGAGFYLAVLWVLKDSMLLAIWSRLTTGTAMTRREASGVEI